MKKKLLILSAVLLAPIMTGCALTGLEDDITVVFEYDGTVIKHDTVHQFKNTQAPDLKKEEIPVGFEFFGWTWLNPDTVKATDTDFKEKYIEKLDVVHYDDVKDYTFNSTVTLQPLFIDEDEVPIPNYYVAIGWYDKESTSGLNSTLMNNWTKDLKAFLKTKGATDEELANVLVKGYVGDVATAGSMIMKDKFVDVVIGFGGNIDTLGGVELKEKVGDLAMGGKQRVCGRLNDKEISKTVLDWIKTDEGRRALQK